MLFAVQEPQQETSSQNVPATSPPDQQPPQTLSHWERRAQKPDHKKHLAEFTHDTQFIGCH